MRELPHNFWPESMTRAGETATRSQMQSAWAQWEGGRGVGLIKALQKAGAGEEMRVWSCSRLADAMLQRARKAGYVISESQKWRDT